MKYLKHYHRAQIRAWLEVKKTHLECLLVLIQRSPYILAIFRPEYFVVSELHLPFLF